jgi:hypothetical protein
MGLPLEVIPIFATWLKVFSVNSRISIFISGKIVNFKNIICNYRFGVPLKATSVTRSADH